MIEDTLDITTRAGAMETFVCRPERGGPFPPVFMLMDAPGIREVKAGSPGEIELYPGVHHGFAFPQRWCYDKPAAERHWERLIALYRRRLG
jgi:carboxymethylenebutenolidase